MIVRSATFRGMRDHNGQKLAEVEVQAGSPGDRPLLAYFRLGPKGYQLVRVLENDARNEVDWYDNDLHTAFRDVTSALLRSPGHEGGEDRNDFAAQVLGADGVRPALDDHFGPAAEERFNGLR